MQEQVYASQAQASMLCASTSQAQAHGRASRQLEIWHQAEAGISEDKEKEQQY